MDQFKVSDGHLMTGGKRIEELAQSIPDDVPFYVYDKAVISATVENLKKALPSDIHVHYAIKANPMPELVSYMAGLVTGFDLASVGEMCVALNTSMSAEHISFAGPAKTDGELTEAIKAGVTINLESENEMRRAHRIGEKLGIKPKVAIRVNPDYDLKASGMKMGGGAKQFGIDAERVPETLKELGSLDLEFRGFHIFWGSQNLREESIMEAHEKTFNLAAQLAQSAPDTVKSLNIGGGLGIPYFPGETRLNLEPISENLDNLLPTLRASLPDTEIVTELGRYLVGESGLYVCRVIDKKVSRGETFLVTNGGLHHHLSASGNFGQVIRKNYPVAIANKMGEKEQELVNVVGPLCTPLDLLGNKMLLPKAEIGDLVVIYQSGAYGYTASPHLFLSHPPPEQLLV
ncbi:MAG: pyridoxal-dependent decarboxylase, exosortase A system-associated [Gammaproteobacteria bacterium]|nr:pyridoxal-dependent decarboxylase, exosortase A system-associated [Gammaproteobacteria bacterium]MDH5694619.1 pyridoxal-dependent decarboxylase, exosortase A system-associated [Gammaproteobacteria bacterium]